MKRESMVFYDSFFEAIKDLPPEEFKKSVCGLLCYGLYGEAPETTGIEKTIYVLSKPLIDKNNQRWENSKKRTEKKTEKLVKAEVTENSDNKELAETGEDIPENCRKETFFKAPEPRLTNDRQEAAVIKDVAQETPPALSDNAFPTVTDGKNMVFYEGTYKNVKLNIAEKCRIINEIGLMKYIDCVKYLSEYLHSNPTLDSGDHMEDILGWVQTAVEGKCASG